MLAPDRGLSIGLTALLLLAGAGEVGARSPGSEAELFGRAEKVFLGLVFGVDRTEAAPEGYPPRHGYFYQALWVRDLEVFKGPAAGGLGYEVVLLPVRERFGPRWLFPAPARSAPATEAALGSRIPPPRPDGKDAPGILFYLVKDDQGAWTVLDGVDGAFEHPGPTRLKALRAKARTARADRR